MVTLATLDPLSAVIPPHEVLVKVGLNRMLLAVTVTVPAILASPVTAAAFAELALKNSGTANRPTNRERCNFID